MCFSTQLIYERHESRYRTDTGESSVGVNNLCQLFIFGGNLRDIFTQDKNKKVHTRPHVVTNPSAVILFRTQKKNFLEICDAILDSL